MIKAMIDKKKQIPSLFKAMFKKYAFFVYFLFNSEYKKSGFVLVVFF